MAQSANNYRQVYMLNADGSCDAASRKIDHIALHKCNHPGATRVATRAIAVRY